MKNVLIIGGSSDIGISFINYFKENNYNVILGYNKNIPNIDEIDKIKCDVRNEEDILNIIRYSTNKYGKIDILINMFCVCNDNDYLSKSKNEFMETIEVNLVGTFLTNKIYSKYIDDGIIINMGSTDGINTYSKYSIDYSASKAGVINLTKSMSLATNNKIICICPNWIDSKSTKSMDKDYLEEELRRIGQSRLIKIEEVTNSLDKIINGNYKSGDIFIIDIKDDELWIKKM